MTSYVPTLAVLTPLQVMPFITLTQKVANTTSRVEAARLLGVSRSTLNRLLDKGYLTDRHARTILPRYKAWKDQQARLAK